MDKRNCPEGMVWTVIFSLIFAALCAVLITCWLGCGRTDVLPTDMECPSGTHAVGDVCVADSNNNEKSCGAGTHWDPEVCEGDGACGKCIADPATPPPPPPTEQLTCGEGTHREGKKCLPDPVPPPCSGDPTKDSFCAIGPFGGALYLPGKMLCLEGLLQCTLYCQKTEVCGNGVDDNCNGRVDDGCPCGPTANIGAGCSGDFGVCAVNGTIECNVGKPVCSTDIGGSQSKATTEVCDGKDNDCDGLVDETDPNAGTICIKNPLLSGESVPHWGQLTCQDVGDGKTKKLICAGNSICFKTETCGNGVDDNCDGYVDEWCLPTSKGVEPSLAVYGSANMPSSQQITLGSINVSLAEFDLVINIAEDVQVTELIIADGSSPGSNNSLKNLRLYHNGILLASSNTWDITTNPSFPLARFTGFKLNIPKGGSATIKVMADITAYDDGGQPSTHELVIWSDINPVMSGKQPPVIAVGLSSGKTIDTIADVSSNYIRLVRTKLFVSLAADSPSGPQVPVAEQTIAKFVVCNSANVGDYPALVNYLKIAVAQKNVYPKNGTLKLRAYDTSPLSSNLLLESTNVYTGTITYSIYGFIPVVEVLAGKCRTLWITLDTANAVFGAGNSLQAILPEDGLGWGDGVGNYNTVDSLPVSGGTLTF